MLKYYLNIADECISLTYWKETHKNMLLTLETMKNTLKIIRKKESISNTDQSIKN